MSNNELEFLDATSHILSHNFTVSRLPELESYYNQSIITANTNTIPSSANDKASLFVSNGGGTSNRHLRRRNGSYKPRRRHRFPNGDFKLKMGKDGDSSKKDGNDEQQQRSRRWRRHPNRLKEKHNAWQKRDGDGVVAVLDDDKEEEVNWLVSHHWHSKRFHTMKLFGWVIPMIHTNRGTKTALKNAKCTLQDASYSAQPLEMIADDREGLTEMLQCVMPGVDLSTGGRLWKGVMYRPDGYPALPIGPVRVLSFKEEEGRRVRVWIMSHPALYETVCNTLSACIKDADDDVIVSGPSAVSGGVGLLRLRGSHASSILSQALFPSPDIDICHLDKARTHGDVIPTSLTVSSTSSSIHALLIAMHPNHSNPTCSGWDILLPPSSLPHLPTLFLTLNHSSAYAIGLVEHTRILTDAHIPCFPRDYPDCPLGALYYDTKLVTDSSKFKQVMDAEDWKWGKHCRDVIKRTNNYKQNYSDQSDCNNSNTNNKSFIDWNLLIYNPNPTTITKQNNDSTVQQPPPVSQKIIVLRGETYGAPFLQLLHYDTLSTNNPSSSQQDNDNKIKTRKRPRRPVSNPNKPILRPIPNKQLLLSQVQIMIASISSNVILRCIIHIENNGILKVGDIIHEYNNNTNNSSSHTKLGVIVSAGFSLIKGTYHGIGFVNGTLFLQAMLHALQEENTDTNHQSLVWICREGRRELRIWVKTDGCIPRLATLFLLL